MTTQSFNKKKFYWIDILAAAMVALVLLTLSYLIFCPHANATTRTAIMKQEEAQTERSVQLRAADPGSPVTNQLWVNTTGDLLKYYNGSTTKTVGGSSSSAGTSSGFNLFTSADNPGFESGATVWTASGGAFTADTSTQFFGTTSGLWDASALNQTLTSAAKLVPVGLQSKPCIATIAYKYTGTASDYKLRVTDTSTMIQESALSNPSTVTDASVLFTCPASGSIDLRIVANVANPGSIELDGSAVFGGLVYLGSAPNLIGNDYIEYTATFTNFGTVTGARTFYRQIGKNIQIMGTFTTGTLPGATLKISLPSGVTLNTNVAVTGTSVAGVYERGTSGTSGYVVLIDTAEPTVLKVGNVGGSSPMTPITGSGSSELQSFFTTLIPIL